MLAKSDPQTVSSEQLSRCCLRCAYVMMHLGMSCNMSRPFVGLPSAGGRTSGASFRSGSLGALLLAALVGGSREAGCSFAVAALSVCPLTLASNAVASPHRTARYLQQCSDMATRHACRRWCMHCLRTMCAVLMGASVHVCLAACRQYCMQATRNQGSLMGWLGPRLSLGHMHHAGQPLSHLTHCSS